MVLAPYNNTQSSTCFRGLQWTTGAISLDLFFAIVPSTFRLHCPLVLRSETMSIATIGKSLAILWISGTAAAVYVQGAGIGTIGLSGISLLDAESGWLVASGADRIRKAALREANIDKLVEAGAISALVRVTSHSDVQARSCAIAALDQLLVYPQARTAALGDRGILSAIEKCAECDSLQNKLNTPSLAGT